VSLALLSEREVISPLYVTAGNLSRDEKALGALNPAQRLEG
jgi:hypothetical protein